MTPTRRRPATPASQGPTGTAPDVPIVAAPKAAPSAKTKDGTQPVGPAAGGDSAPPTLAGQTDPEAPPTQARRRPGGLYPLPVWPD